MAILPILKYPDARLRNISSPIVTFDEALASLDQDMRETMLNAPGSGLAAPQVNRLLRIIVIDDSAPDEDYGSRVLTLVNPKIVNAAGELVYREGCLSVLDLQAEVRRAEEVTVEAQDIAGQNFTITAKGRKAVILQHEIDHLDGVLFVDRVSRLIKDMYLKKRRKFQKQAQNS
ncbi:MAG: peptide deformylase [Deltaproteobacteria bacterium]|jgi:peptide deformylase|nr:peptide deformylase [Deltaproteobacteria bacterium]